jgi:(p)ppGpp synthase/HD superfamily hydrolase
MTQPTSRLSSALAYAERVHAGVMRKDTNIPYVTHVMGVSVMVLEAGGTEDEAIAGLLHDTLEDGGDPDGIRSHILKEFGARVLEIVEAMSDATPGAGEKKAPWRPRKEAYIAHLSHCDDAGVHRVCLSDKLYNLRATNDDFDEIGDPVWKRFRTGPDEQLWYYSSLGDAFAGGPLSATRAEMAYRRELERLRRALTVAGN